MLDTEVLKQYKVYVKYTLMFVAAVLVKYMMDFLFKKPEIEKKASPAAPTVESDSNRNDNGLFADKTVVESSDTNYFYNTYQQQINDEDKKHVPFSLPRLPEDEMIKRADEFYRVANQRRTCRFFSPDTVPRAVIEKCILAAGTSPSGAHTEPWKFVVVLNPEERQAVREIVENEEQLNYEKRMGKKWLSDLAKLRTTFVKEYISEASCIILVFKEPYHMENGVKQNNWYYEASVSISVGILLCALNNVGLATVTSTPMNCGPALRRIFNRPEHEKLAFLLPIGYPAETATVPDMQRKPLNEICTFIE